MRVDLKPREGFQDDPFIYKLKTRLRQDMNSMIASTGYPRRGKSESETTIAENMSLNRPFKARDISFLPQNYMGNLVQGEPGDFVQFDEPGAEYSNRNFMTVVNKMLNATHITFGSKLITVGWAVPSLKMQDVTTMRLLTYFFTMDAEGPKGRARFYKTWMDSYSGKFGREQLGRVWFAEAWQDRPEERKEYLEMKRQYQDESYEKYYKEFAKSDDDFKDKIQDSNDKMAQLKKTILADPIRYLNSQGKFDYNLVFQLLRNELRIKRNEAQIITKELNQTTQLTKKQSKTKELKQSLTNLYEQKMK